MKNVLTWDEIFINAIDAGCGDWELKVKDCARYEVVEMLKDLGYPNPENDDVTEDSIEFYCDKLNIRFNEKGNIESIKLPDYIFGYVMKGRENK